MKGKRGRHNRYARFSVMAIVSGILLHISGPAALCDDFQDWDRGADGYPYALSEAREDEKPLVLYFHQDDCAWSRKMNERYLAAGAVRQFLQAVPCVEVNPDRDADDEALCKAYGIRDYPAFLVLMPAFDTKPQRIHPFGPDGEMTVAEFLGALRQWIVNQYHVKGHAGYEAGQYERTLRHYERALQYDAENVYTYHALGVTYQAVFTREEDPDLLQRAEECYRKALKLDPGHKASKEGLEALGRWRKAKGLPPSP